MTRVEEAAIIACLREINGIDDLSFGKSEDVVNLIIKLDDTIDPVKAQSCIEGRPVNKTQTSRIVKAALLLLRDKQKAIFSYYTKHNLPTAIYIDRLLSRKNSAADIIFRNWTMPVPLNRRGFKSGVYQIIRRYKPYRDQDIESLPNESNSWSNDKNHAVICELIYVDSDAMECVLITAELYVYFGSLFVNHENQLNGLMQRLNPRTKGINQRFISSKLEDNELPVHAGICVKTGDVTHLPIAATCFYLKIPPTHMDLHKSMMELYGALKADPDNQMTMQVRKDSIFSQYITDYPPIMAYIQAHPAWRRVKFVRDFPALAKRVVPDSAGIRLFREPSRTPNEAQLRDIAVDSEPLEIFRHDGWVPENQGE